MYNTSCFTKSCILIAKQQSNVKLSSLELQLFNVYASTYTCTAKFR